MRWIAVRTVVALLFWLSGCKQGRNERCQLNSDCINGLVCVLGGASCAVGGLCQFPDDTDRGCRETTDCPAGLVCQRSTLCSDQGRSICVMLPDLSVALSDLSSDLTTAPSDGGND